jgi:uncharacterized protein (DUF1330 family)
MTTYAIVGINVKDPTAYREYLRRAGRSFAGSGITVLAASDAPFAVEGVSPFSRYVLLQFPDRAAFDAWYTSPAYQDAIPFRHANAETGLFVLLDDAGLKSVKPAGPAGGVQKMSA